MQQGAYPTKLLVRERQYTPPRDSTKCRQDCWPGSSCEKIGNTNNDNDDDDDDEEEGKNNTNMIQTLPKRGAGGSDGNTGRRSLPKNSYLILLLGVMAFLLGMVPSYTYQYSQILRRTTLSSTTALNKPSNDKILQTHVLLESLRCQPSDKESEGYTLPMYEFFDTTAPLLPRLDFGLASSPEYSHSRFAQHYPLRTTTTHGNNNNNSVAAVHFVVLSDRHPHNTSHTPLKALVHSILTHVSVPVDLHVATSHNSIDWLDALDSPFFQVNFYNYEKLGYLGNAVRMIKTTNFQSKHRGMPYPLTKPFLSNLPLPGREEGHIDRVIALDDDILFWDDPVKLLQLLPADKLALSCPLDPKRAHRYYNKTNLHHNGHDTRYCNSGFIHMPILPRRPHELYHETNDLLDMYIDAIEGMTAEYPGVKYRCSDQEVYNRVFRWNQDKMGNIPCEWHCDYNSQRFNKGWEFSNCPEIGKPGPDGEIVQCKVFHLLGDSYKDDSLEVDKKEHEYKYFFEMDSMELLYKQFMPRMLGDRGPKCSDTAVATSAI